VRESHSQLVDIGNAVEQEYLNFVRSPDLPTQTARSHIINGKDLKKHKQYRYIDPITYGIK